MQIEVDFDVYKALTVRREHEAHSYNDVLRELLSLDSIQEADKPEHPLQNASDLLTRPLGVKGFHGRGIHLPEGTALRARHKNREYQARITGEQWVGENGQEYSSASAAASAITGTTVNGLRFWEAKRPGDSTWYRLELLRDR